MGINANLNLSNFLVDVYSFNWLPEHRKGESGDWVDIMERLRDKLNCYDFQHFINGVKKENPGHINKALHLL